MPARPGSGRKPKPTVDHVQEGTFRRDRHGPEGGVRPADGQRPEMPVGFTPMIEAAWWRLLDDLEASALLDSADAPLYEAFAVSWGRAREARELIGQHGMLIAGAREGTLVANPMLRVEQTCLTQVRYLADQLAIGMRARASLGLAVARGGRRSPAGEQEEPAQAGVGLGALGPSPRLVGIAGGSSSA